MLSASPSYRTNAALSQASTLAQLAREENRAQERKACLCACLWQLELAQRAFSGELLQHHHALDPTNLTIEQLIEQLAGQDKILPELNQLRQLRQQHPTLVIAARVAISGAMPAAPTDNQLIGSQWQVPDANAVQQACAALVELVELARKTSQEW